MRKLTLLLLISLPIFSKAQAKKDSVKIDSAEVRTLYRNSNIIQQYLHKVHIDATLRDQLDSVYNVSAAIFEKSLKKKNKK
jgi:hypothetical protein